MAKTVKELIEELKKYNEDAQIVTITVGTNGNWVYTENPKLSSHSNMFGERVFIK